MSANNDAASELFLLLAGLWKPPDEQEWEEIRSGEVDAELLSFSFQAGHARWWQEDVLQNRLVPLETLQSFYLRYFMGIGSVSALPIESVYKKWTEDPAARLPIAGSTGYLMGDPALHVKYLLDHYGLAVPKDYAVMPDHLTLLFELAAFMVKQRPVNEVRVFCEQHLDWLDALDAALLEAVPDGEEQDPATRVYYQTVLFASRLAVAAELQRYSKFEE